MRRIIDILRDIFDGNSKVRLLVTSVFSIVLVSILMLGSTYSLFSSSNVDEDLNVYKTGNLDITYTLSSDNVKLTNNSLVTIEDSVYIEPYTITINNSGNVPYMFDILLVDSTATDVISYEYIMTQVGKLEAKRLSKCNDNIIKEDVIVPAGESVSVDVRVFLAEDIKNSELGKSFYAKLSIEGLAVYNDDVDIDNSILKANVIYNSNRPNLDTGLIPVYYDEISNVWKKANEENKNNSWYDYSNKKWANAVLVSDSIKREEYLNSKIGTVINDEDIVGFFVWIPRFKYRVWNINRGIDESNYVYDVVKNGIEIKWEKGIRNTGNVSCTYDEGDFVDTCVYDDVDVINNDTLNSDYKDAWYTHPAFTNEENNGLEGFWVGKFETTVNEEEVMILPDRYSNFDLTDMKVEDLYNMSSKFSNYGLTNLNSVTLSNLEWGAVSYLTHSIYGVCDNKGCSDLVSNKSYYTGMSLEEDNKKYGSHNYKGFLVDVDTGNVLEEKDTNMLSSNTKNITGIYDMSGASYELMYQNGDNVTRLGDATVEFSNYLSEDNDDVKDVVKPYLLRGKNNSLFSSYGYTGEWNKTIGGITVRTILK